MSGHRIEWRHDRDTIHGRVVCDETDEWTDCRVVCAEDCEQWPAPDPGNRTHEVLDDAGHPLGKHAMRHVDYCNYVTWMDEASIEELFDGGSDVPVHDGPVAFTWTGDGYDWHYAEQERAS